MDRAAERLQENLKDDEPNDKDAKVVNRDEGADVPMDDNDNKREGQRRPNLEDPTEPKMKSLS